MEINGNSKVQCLVNVINESQPPSHVVTVFVWCSRKQRKQMILHYPDGRWWVFCWLIPDAFHWGLISVGLNGSSTCWNETFGLAHHRGCPSIDTTLPFLDEDWPLVWLVVIHFAWPTISSIPHYCTVSTFHHPSPFVLKTEHFCYVSVENPMWKYGQEDFSCLTYVEPKHQSD